MKHLRRLVWSKGMFLTPQHFQAQERFYADNVQFRFTSSLYANWGVSKVDADRDELTNGVLAVTHCRGVLPDGLCFDIPMVDAPPPRRSIADHFQPNNDFLDIYIAIPEHRPNSQSVTHISAAGSSEPRREPNTRYTSENFDVRDENNGDEERIVQVARKNFRILFGDEVLDGMTTIRIGRIIRDQGAKFILDPEFVAPCLDIESSTYLMNLVKRQIELLRNKSGTLAAARRQKGQDLSEFGNADVANFWLLHTVNSYMPELNHIWKRRHGHPEPLFVAMLRLAGALSTFAFHRIAQELPDYDHNDLGPCFTKLDAQIRDLVDTVIPTKCISVPLRHSPDQFIWTGKIGSEAYFRDSQFFLAVTSRLSVAVLVDRAPNVTKIAAPDEIQTLIRLSLAGVGLRHVSAPPSAIPLRLDNQYFALDQKSELWESVERSRSISLYIPSDIPDAKVELLIVLQ